MPAMRWNPLQSGSLDSPVMREAVKLLQRWPEGYACFIRLIHTFYPVDDPRTEGGGHGCTCGSDAKFPGEIYVTTYDALGTAEGMCHETGHTKLRLLGIDLEKWDTLILNNPSELFDSPIRKDKKRPMGAVLHAQLSYSNVLDLDLHALAVESDTKMRERILESVRIHYRKLLAGFHEIQSHIKVDRDGAAFMDGYYRWAEGLFEQAAKLI
jgi:HEXXH motif-containing protein